MSHHRPNREPLVAPGAADLHVRDMTATFSADVTLAEAQRRLAEHDQWLPIDGDPDRSLGELVDRNSTGPLRLGYGAWRDLLLGVQFLNGRGELVTAGGRTVKNVAGHDLTKLMVGQQGRFGRLVTLTTRTYRRPAGAVLAAFDPSLDRVAELLPSPLKPQWMLLTRESLFCGYLGDERTLAFYADRLPTIGAKDVTPRGVDADIEHRRSLWCFSGESAFRASLPPAKVLEFVSAAKLEQWSADPAFGIVVGVAGESSAIRSAAESLGGSVRFSADAVSTSSPLVDRLSAAFS